MFFRAIKAVISRQPEPLNLSDFFHFEVYSLRFDFCKIMLPHDRFKLSTLVHLEGPLTLLLATVIITLEL